MQTTTTTKAKTKLLLVHLEQAEGSVPVLVTVGHQPLNLRSHPKPKLSFCISSHKHTKAGNTTPQRRSAPTH